MYPRSVNSMSSSFSAVRNMISEAFGCCHNRPLFSIVSTICVVFDHGVLRRERRRS